MERRLPIIVVVRLARAISTDNQKTGQSKYVDERTYTDNISLHGARVFSRSPWTPGEPVRVAPLNQAYACGSIAYCERLEDDRYAIGVSFRNAPINWSVMERYAGA
jgi:hypothetical protein